MNRFYNLLKIEFKKTFSSTFIFIALSIFIFFIFFATNSLSGTVETAPRDDYWMSELNDQNLNIDMYISENPDLDASKIADLIGIKEINLYRIENNLQPIKNKSIVGLLQSNNIAYLLISIVTLIVATKIITDEFKYDSIKLLASQPFRRSEILSSKLLIVFITPFISMLIMFILSILFGGIYFGVDDLSSVYVGYVDNAIVRQSYMLFIFKQWVQQSISLISISTMALFLGIVFKNAIISILTSVLTYILGTYLTVFFIQYEWIKYTVFPHVNYYLYVYDDVVLPTYSVEFSYMIVLLYLVIFVCGSFIVFNKKEF
ncbi:MAG: ABC transporter permease [Tenericutes bacterium]|nr:ABC transporter permease [Mycoplasmatota bacterium]